MNKEYTIILTLSIALVILTTTMMMQPQQLCDKWGGTLYSDGSCLLLENMSLCKDQYNRIFVMDKFDMNISQLVRKYNITGVN